MFERKSNETALTADAEGKQMEELKRLAKAARAEAREAAAEKERLVQMRARATAALANAARGGDLTSEKVQRRVADARIQLDIVKSREGSVEDRANELLDELESAFQAEVVRWNTVVIIARARTAEQMIQANIPFWGSERECRRAFAPERIESLPGFSVFRQAYYHTGDRLPGDLLRQVESLIDKELEYSNWPSQWAKLPPLPTPPVPTERELFAAERAAESEILKVRVKEPFYGEGLGLRKKDAKRSDLQPWRTVQKGEALEMTRKDYKALARYLELLGPGDGTGLKVG